jgi:hypothetical protein
MPYVGTDPKPSATQYDIQTANWLTMEEGVGDHTAGAGGAGQHVRPYAHAQGFRRDVRFQLSVWTVLDGWPGGARSKTDLAAFFNLSNAPRQLVSIPAPLGASYFLNDKSLQLPPDDD